MSPDPFDPRAICNALLDEGARCGVPVTNLALQKLLYFAHGLHLMETKRPLVSGYFEAWQHGPVHPTAYAAFKRSKEQPISFRAHRQDPLTGCRIELPAVSDDLALKYVGRVMAHYGRLSAGRLVTLSHAPQGPWHSVVESAKSAMVLGLRIPDTVIAARFKYHMASVGSVPSMGEPCEDAPFA